MIRSLMIFSFLIIAQVSSAVPAHWTAATTEFWLPKDFGFGEKVFYRCDSVEKTAQKLLADMGARNIKVECQGGIEDYSPNWDAYLILSFESLRSVTTGEVDAQWKSVELNDRDNCFLVMSILDAVKPHFEMTNREGTAKCRRPGSSYNVKMTTLME